MAKKNTAMGGDELKKKIAAYETRRKQRLDEAEKADTENNDTDGLTGVPPADANPQSATAEERVQLVKDRRDRRDQEGDPKTPEEMLGVIAQQDEDIGDLFEIVEGLLAKQDFDASCKDNAQPDAENEDEDKEDEDDKDGGGVTLKIQTDAMDAIVRDRLKLVRLGDSLNLDGLEDMKPLDIKKAVIKKVNPNMRLDGKGAGYINAAFDAAVASLGTGSGKDCNYQRRQMTARTDSRTPYTPTGKTGAAAARERMIERQQNGGNE